MIRGAIALASLALLAACVPTRPASVPTRDLDLIEASLAAHIAVLASDDYGGRKPGTEGETRTLRYLAREWQSYGLESGTNDPSNPWYAPVDLTVTGLGEGEVWFTFGSRRVVLPEDAVTVISAERRDLIEDASMVFVGNVAAVDPIELTGRVAVLNFDPSMSFERIDALAKSDAAAILVLGTGAEIGQILSMRRSGTYRLGSQPVERAPIVLVDRETAFARPNVAPLVGRFATADSPDFRPEALPFKLSLDTRSPVSEIRTHNLIGRLPGSDPSAGAVLLLAHWDHFGECGAPDDEDRICNGAVDNASGLAVLTELARALSEGPQLERDVYFLATTAEEWGLLGTYAFTRDPPMPLDTLVAAFNLDSSALARRGSAIGVIGAGYGPLDSEVEAVIAAMGRRIAGRDFAEDYVRRQDGWALMQADVPTLMISSSFGDRDLLDRYTRERYHMASDEVAGMELGGAAEDFLLHLALVRHFGMKATHSGARE